VALCLDLTLRRATAHGPAVTLDDIMRRVWARCAGGPMREADFAAVLHECAQRSFAPEITAWIHGTGELPLRPLLQQHGITVTDEPAQLAQRLGLRASESGGVHIKTVLRGGAAERAGLAAGDEWLGVEVGKLGWRLTRLDDLPLYAGAALRVMALVSRDKRLLRLPLRLPRESTTWRLSVRDASAVNAWLSPGD